MEQYNYNYNNQRNLYPFSNLQNYSEALCGVGIKQPTFMGAPPQNLTLNGTSTPFIYTPLCVKFLHNKNGDMLAQTQRYNVNYTGLVNNCYGNPIADQYARAMR